MRLKVTTAIAAMVLASAAQAAEEKKPFNWSGLYIGANVGYAAADNNWSDYHDPLYPQFNTLIPGPDASIDMDGVTVGGQVGYNWQVGTTVFGIEATGNWSDLDGIGNNSSNVFGGCLTHVQCKTEIEAFGTLTGRLGGTFDRGLIYVKGGLAWARQNHEVDYIDTTAPGGPQLLNVAKTSETRLGWTVGAGIEYALTANWSARAEYNYIKLQDEDVHMFFNPAETFSVGADSSEDIHSVNVGLNYRFNN